MKFRRAGTRAGPLLMASDEQPHMLGKRWLNSDFSADYARLQPLILLVLLTNCSERELFIVGRDPRPNGVDCDRDEFAGLLEAEQPFFTSVVRSVVPEPAAAADIVQRANLAIWQKRADFEPGSHFRRWAIAFIRYELLAYRRTLARTREVMLSSAAEQLLVTAAEESPDDTLARQQLALRDCLSALRSEDIQLLAARYEQAESLESFAKRSGRSAGGLRVSLHRLRQSLRACIEKKLLSEQNEFE